MQSLTETSIKYRTKLHKLLPKNPVVVELGVAEGYFSRDMLNWKLKKLYMVDMWECHPEFPGDAGSPQEWHNKNYTLAMERVKEFTNVEVLRGPTVAMAQYVKDNSVDLVYIDACHAYKNVKADINAWMTKIKPGGVMAFHDYLNNDYGVKQAVDEIGLAVGVISENKTEDAGAWVRKPL